MERLKSLNYRGENFQVPVEVYEDSETGEEYTTTESDQRWWENLRTQYLSRHPEILQEFIESFPEDKINIISPGIYEASMDGEVKSGKTKEEALRKLWVSLAI